MAKGKTPSLIGSSLGRPSKKTGGRETPCSRCHVGIPKGEDCYDVPHVPFFGVYVDGAGTSSALPTGLARRLITAPSLCSSKMFDA